MKRIVLRVLFVLAVFVCGYVSGVLINGPGKAEAGYGCMYYTASGCYNSGGAGDELYVEIKFTKPMTFKGMASSVDKKTFMPYFLPQ